jgi:S-adenosylmethionine decarboxylase
LSDGRHLILDLYGCDPEALDDYQGLLGLLETALDVADANVLRIIGEKFEPQGVTLVALLSESHASLHSWPEAGYMAVDLYTCGEKTKTHAAAEVLKQGVKAKFAEEKELVRSTTQPELFK